jgi:hypothetical protein
MKDPAEIAMEGYAFEEGLKRAVHRAGCGGGTDGVYD